MVNLTNVSGKINYPDFALNSKNMAEGVNLVKTTVNTVNENGMVTNVSNGTQKIVDTVKNNKSVIEDITEHFPNFITQNVGNITSKISDTGEKFINYVKENPFTYAAGIGAAALTYGIVIGRISKSDKLDTDSNSD